MQRELTERCRCEAWGEITPASTWRALLPWWTRTPYRILVWQSLCAGYLVLGVAQHNGAEVLAALVLAGAGDLLMVAALVAVKWAQWWRSTARRAGGCGACGTVWAGRAEFVRAHRDNDPTACRWWAWTPMASFCPRCLRDL